MSRCIGVVIVCALLSVAQIADSQEGILMDFVAKARAARLANDAPAWLNNGRETLRFAPDHPDLLISVSRALAANDRAKEAVPYLNDAIQRGAGFDLSTFPEFAKTHGDAMFQEIALRARENLKAVPRAEVHTRIQDAEMRPEGITYDPKTKRFFVGSMRGEIWQIDAEKRLSLFVPQEMGLREVFGLKVDAERRLLWAVTGVFPNLLTNDQKKDLGIAGVQVYNVDSGRLVRKCWIDERPVLHGFNDLVLAENGDAYITDSPFHAVYRLRSGHDSFELVVRDPAMSFPNGIVIRESLLYVAHVEGISAIDARTGKRTKLPVPANASVNSIDGLAWQGSDLLGIQASPYLARTARITLGEDGLSVTKVTTVNSRTPEDLNPTTGVVVDSSFFTVATQNAAPGAAPPSEPPLPAIIRVELPSRLASLSNIVQDSP